jgi:hypothetical protein
MPEARVMNIVERIFVMLAASEMSYLVARKPVMKSKIDFNFVSAVLAVAIA